MSEQEILEGNKLIAEFMGSSVYEKGVLTLTGEQFSFSETDIHPQVKYHSSWDWIMPVVENIELTELASIVIKGVKRKPHPHQHVVNLYFNNKDIKDVYWRKEHESKIFWVYQAVIYFIKWYNAQKTKII